MATLTGLATLVLPDGTRVQGIGSLRSERAEPGRERPWGGSFRPDSPSPDLFRSLGCTVHIELPTGETGEVLVEGVEGSGQDTAVRLVGSGPPPF
jgi:hypothetical protein